MAVVIMTREDNKDPASRPGADTRETLAIPRLESDTRCRISRMTITESGSNTAQAMNGKVIENGRHQVSLPPESPMGCFCSEPCRSPAPCFIAVEISREN